MEKVLCSGSVSQIKFYRRLDNTKSNNCVQKYVPRLCLLTDSHSTMKTQTIKTHRRSWGSFLSWGTRSTHGHIPIERTNRCTRSPYWVGKGGHLLQDHFLTNLNHVLSREGWSLCNKSSQTPHASLEIAGSDLTVQHVLWNITEQGMLEQQLPLRGKAVTKWTQQRFLTVIIDLQPH